VHKLGAAVLAIMLDSDSIDDDEVPDLHHWKKKRRAKLLNAQAALQPILYVNYLKLADDCTEPFSTTSIFHDSSHLGEVFLRRFRPP
jgi:uncharacterized protein YueI